VRVAPGSEPANGNDGETLVGVIESFRSYLLLVAERALAPDLRVKEAASDLVQEALAGAQRQAGCWTGGPAATDELRDWLKALQPLQAELKRMAPIPRPDSA